MAELKLTRSGATPKLFISFKVFCTPGFGKAGWAFEVDILVMVDGLENLMQPSTSPTEA